MKTINTKKIKIGKNTLDALSVRLLDKTFILLRGNKGYIMCGYLNMSAANKFKDVAVKIKGISTIDDALRATVFSCSRQAKKLGVKKGQPVKDVLYIIA